MIKNFYDKELNILYITRYGDIDSEELLSNIKCVGEKFNYLDSLYILEDARSSKSLFNKNDYPLYIEEIQDLLLKFKKITLALVVDAPANTALSMLFEMIADNLKNYNISIFSTIKAAERWLLNEISIHGT